MVSYSTGHLVIVGQLALEKDHDSYDQWMEGLPQQLESRLLDVYAVDWIATFWSMQLE